MVFFQVGHVATLTAELQQTRLISLSIPGIKHPFLVRVCARAADSLICLHMHTSGKER